MEALRAGAVEVMAKPGGPYSVGELRTALAGEKIRAGGSFTYRAAAHREPRPEAASALAAACPGEAAGFEPVGVDRDRSIHRRHRSD